MERSPEIEAVFRRLNDALLVGDRAAVENLIAEHAHVRVITTGADEWWSGHEQVVPIVLARTRESGAVRFDFSRLEGFELGKVGWVAAEVEGHRVSEDPIVLRETMILMLEAGTWRVVQWHISTGVPNVEVFGHEMPKSLGDLVSSLDEAHDLLDSGMPTGTVTVMFTDLVDSTAASERVGDEVWTQLVADHFELLRRITERSGGTVVKTLGDGTMTVFSSARSAIEAAITLQETMEDADLRIRIGIHTGDSLRKEGDYYGVAVNKAARIAAIAKGGEIMASGITAELSGKQGPSFGLERKVSLKGLDGTHVIVPVEWAADSATSS